LLWMLRLSVTRTDGCLGVLECTSGHVLYRECVVCVLYSTGFVRVSVSFGRWRAQHSSGAETYEEVGTVCRCDCTVVATGARPAPVFIGARETRSSRPRGEVAVRSTRNQRAIWIVASVDGRRSSSAATNGVAFGGDDPHCLSAMGAEENVFLGPRQVVRSLA